MVEGGKKVPLKVQPEDETMWGRRVGLAIERRRVSFTTPVRKGRL